MITKDQLITWATAHGWQRDRWGHLQKEFDNGTHRLKLSRIAARHEIKTPHGWFRVRSGYYKDLTITADGKLAGMDVLRLGERLRNWMAMDTGPFQFTLSRRLWTAVFECASQRR